MVSFASPSRPRNWTCACAPGLLGPPPSIIPPAVRVIVEISASGPPLNCKLSVHEDSSIITINWHYTQAVLSTNPHQHFPPALLSALEILCPLSPSWSIGMDNDLLSCEITWSTSTPPSASTPCPPKVPSSPPDSGYCSLSSPINNTFPCSPVPFVIEPPASELSSVMT